MMFKFKSMKQKYNERKSILRGEVNNYNIDALNQKYDELIEKFKKEKFVTSETKEIGVDLSVLKEEVDKRLLLAQREVRRLDQLYNRSIVTKEDFDLDYYKKVKENAFKLDSLSRTLDERLSAIEITTSMRK